MDDTRKVLALGLTILLALAVVVGVYLLFFRPGGEKPPPADKARAEKSEKDEGLAADIPDFTGATLDTSDALIRRLAGEMSAHPRIGAWLPSSDIIRRV